MGPTDVFSSTPGRVLTGAVGLAAVLLVASLVGDVGGRELVLAAALSGLAVLAVWAGYGRPAVEVSDGTVVLRNVLRTVTIPWPTVRRAEVGWSLVVHTTGGSWTAWAAPRSSGTARAVRRRRGHRPDDAPGTPGHAVVHDDVAREGTRRRPATAEAVAAAIDARLDALRRAGHLADADAVVAAHGIRPTVRWHTGTVATALALAAAAVASRLV